MLNSNSLKPLIVYLNALACTSIIVNSQLYEIIARISVQVFSSKPTVVIVALRQSIKSVLMSLGHEESYIGAKSLVMC